MLNELFQIAEFGRRKKARSMAGSPSDWVGVLVPTYANCASL